MFLAEILTQEKNLLGEKTMQKVAENFDQETRTLVFRFPYNITQLGPDTVSIEIPVKSDVPTFSDKFEQQAVDLLGTHAADRFLEDKRESLMRSLVLRSIE